MRTALFIIGFSAVGIALFDIKVTRLSLGMNKYTFSAESGYSRLRFLHDKRAHVLASVFFEYRYSAEEITAVLDKESARCHGRCTVVGDDMRSAVVYAVEFFPKALFSSAEIVATAVIISKK